MPSRSTSGTAASRGAARATTGPMWPSCWRTCGTGWSWGTRMAPKPWWVAALRQWTCLLYTSDAADDM
eukprot:539531-Lingulodinium_polyedra.AAC.1